MDFDLENLDTGQEELPQELRDMATICWFYHYTPTEYWALKMEEQQALLWAINEAHKESK